MKYIGENAIKKLISLIKSDIKKKLDKNQGTNNARKALVVGEDGNVVPEALKDGFCITFTSGPDTIVADKTLAEIQQAYNEGKTIYGIRIQGNNKIYFNLYSATDTSFVFQNVTTVKINGEIANTNLLRIGGIISDNDIQWQEIDIHVPAFTDSDKEKLDSAQPLITATGLLEGDGAGNITAADTETATLVDVPNGLVKGDGTTLSAAVAGTDYVTPDGMSSAVAETKPFIVTVTRNPNAGDGGAYIADKTFVEIKTAYDAGKMCLVQFQQLTTLYCIGVNNEIALFSGAATRNNTSIVTITITNENRAISVSFNCQKIIGASGLLKGNGKGTVSAAVAGTDYMAPPTGGTAGQVLTKTADSQQWADAPKSLPDGGTTGDALVKSTDGGSWETPVEASLVEIMTKSEVESAIQSAIQNTWEASY